ncbi:hypothetical protein D9M68_509730 [compost metagenome]
MQRWVHIEISPVYQKIGKEFDVDKIYGGGITVYPLKDSGGVITELLFLEIKT